MRTTDEYFPYDSELICYLFITHEGIPKQIKADISPQEAYDQTITNQGTIIAIWPGKYHSDAFLIDPHKFGLHFGCITEPFPFEIVGYTHIDTTYDTPQSKSVTFFLDAPDRHDSSLPNFLNRFEKELTQQFGWTIAKSKGYGASSKQFNPDTNEYEGYISVTVHIKNLTNSPNWRPIQTVWGNLPKSIIDREYESYDFAQKFAQRFHL